MTSFQKIIKYAAIAFAIYLCFMIISMILFGIMAIFGITTGMGMFETDSNTAMITKWEQEYTNINSINIDLSICKLNIKKGDTLKVEASEVSDKFECKVEENKLKIADDNLGKNFFDFVDVAPEVTIYLPEKVELAEVQIETGVNETNIEYLKADKVKLEMGVGKYKIYELIANYAKIEAGAGEANIENGNIGELKLEGGVGKLTITSKITTKADINCGMGKVDVNLVGFATDYTVKVHTGLGNFEVNGQKVSDNQTIGNGNVVIEIEAGVGETIVEMSEKKRPQTT